MLEEFKKHYTRWNAWNVRAERLPAFLDSLNKSDAGFSCPSPYAAQVSVTPKEDGTFTVVAQCVDYPYVKNELSRLAST